MFFDCNSLIFQIEIRFQNLAESCHQLSRILKFEEKIEKISTIWLFNQLIMKSFQRTQILIKCYLRLKNNEKVSCGVQPILS